MNHKSEILKALRKDLLPEPALPSLDQEWIKYDDIYSQFEQALASVGGQCHIVDSISDVQDRLRDVPAYRDGNQICSLVEGVEGNVDANSVDDPHELEHVDFAIANGHFAVAENGAVWVSDEAIKHRVVLFLSQHISLVVPKSELLNNMYEGYQRIQHVSGVFGVFISGPSKTADIEQSLVIGAHGARSMNVFLVENV